MILADTSVWVDHFRNNNAVLARQLSASLILIHPFVVGELACGNLKDRKHKFAYFALLRQAELATHDEVLRLIEDRKLWGLGIGWTDAHLLASAGLSACRLWTLDQRLLRAAARVGLKTFNGK
jgi:predicted nucleic acid-binding protein